MTPRTGADGYFSLRSARGLVLRSPSRTPPTSRSQQTQIQDNVYEVTLVVKDGTVDKMGMPHRDELKVTVKVINSEEDNQPGKVKLSNRQPEEETAETVLTADAH